MSTGYVRHQYSVSVAPGLDNLVICRSVLSQDLGINSGRECEVLIVRSTHVRGHVSVTEIGLGGHTVVFVRTVQSSPITLWRLGQARQGCRQDQNVKIRISTPSLSATMISKSKG